MNSLWVMSLGFFILAGAYHIRDNQLGHILMFVLAGAAAILGGMKWD